MATGRSGTSVVAALTVAAPVGVYLVAVWLLHGWPVTLRQLAPIVVVCVAIFTAALAATWVGVPLAVVTMSLIVAGFVAYNVATMAREPA